MKRIYLSVGVALTCLMGNVNAQSRNWQWAASIGGTNDDGAAISIAADPSGNVYATGNFQGTIDFDSDSVGIFYLTSAGSNDIFISKSDNSGNFAWAKRIGGIIGESSVSIAVDASGSVYTTGSITGTVDFDPGPGIFNLTPAGNYDIFISKLDSAGNFVWAKTLGGTQASWGTYIFVDDSFNVYTTGTFKGVADFDPGIGISNLTSAGDYDIFISKLDSSGNFVWAKQIGGTFTDVGNALAVDISGNVYTTGQFSLTADFDPDSATSFNLTSNGAQEIFILKINSSGNFVWAKSIGSTSTDLGYIIGVDDFGNVYTKGTFGGTVDFDPGAGIFNLIAGGLSNIFLSKLNTAGDFLWAKIMAGGSTWSSSMVIDAPGNIYSAGIFNNDILIDKSDSSGNSLWIKSAGGTNIDRGKSLVLDNAGHICVAGTFYSDSVSFGPIILVNHDISANTTDIFIAKLDTVLVTGNYDVSTSFSTMSIYPNPANTHFTLDLASYHKRAKIIITDITGQLIFNTVAIETQKIEVNTKDFVEGIYFVQIQSGDFIEIIKLLVAK